MAASGTFVLASALMAVAVVHSFTAGAFLRLARRWPRGAGLWRLLGEVELVFALWSLVLLLAIAALTGPAAALAYLRTRSFTEPLFVLAIMLVAATRPVLTAATHLIRWIARLVPLADGVGAFAVTLSVVPALGSVITEPAAMTLAALLLSRRYFAAGLSRTLRYATVGTLFVNVSLGGTLTPFAAPAVLMVATPWHWDLSFMLTHFGGKAALAVLINTALVTLYGYRELKCLPADRPMAGTAVRGHVLCVHLAVLAGLILVSHQPALLLLLLLVFLAYVRRSAPQDPLVLREALLVGAFLSGLVILGGLQRWWLEPLLQGLEPGVGFGAALLLTSVIDNAALTYLASRVADLAPALQYAIVAGAVCGGGLTLIANAPNPAGIAILRKHFTGGSVSPAGLAVAAVGPTLIAAAIFWLI